MALERGIDQALAGFRLTVDNYLVVDAAAVHNLAGAALPGVPLPGG